MALGQRKRFLDVRGESFNKRGVLSLDQENGKGEDLYTLDNKSRKIKDNYSHTSTIQYCLYKLKVSLIV